MNKKSIHQYFKYVKTGLSLNEFIHFKVYTSLEDLYKLFKTYRNLKAEFPERGLLFPKANIDLFVPSISNDSMVFLYATTIYECRRYTEVDFKFFLSVILQYKDKINGFIEKRTLFERLYLLGMYKEALLIVEDVESQIAMSLWAIQARFRIFEATSNTNEMLNYAEQILQTIDNSKNPYIKTIISMLVVKYTSTIDNDQAIKRKICLFQELKKQNTNEKEYNKLKLYVDMLTSIVRENDVSLKENIIGESLSIFLNVGLIDKWIIIEQMLSRFFINSLDERYQFSKEFLLDLSFLNRLINSPVCRNILMANNIIQYNDNLENNFSTQLELLMRNKCDMNEFCLDYINKAKNPFDAIVAMAQYGRKLKNIVTPLERIIESIRSMILIADNGSKFFGDTDKIDRLSRILLDTEVGYGLISFTENYSFDHPSKARISRLLEILHYDGITFETNEILYTGEDKSNYTACISLPIYKWYYLDYYTDSFEAGLPLQNVKKDDTIDWCLRISSYQTDELKMITDHLLSKKSLTYDQCFKMRRVILALYEQYEKNNCWTDLFKLYFTAYITSPCLTDKMMHIVVPTTIFREYRTEYYFSDYYYLTQIASDNNSKIRDSDRMYNCYSNILRKYQAEYPSELPCPEDTFDKMAWLFFLRNVCVLEMLKRAFAHGTEEDRINERICILNILLNEPDYSQKYHYELVSERETLELKLENYYLSWVLDIKLDLSQISPEHNDYITQCFQSYKQFSADMMKRRIEEYRNGLRQYTQDYALILDGMIGMHIRHAFFASEIRSVFANYDYLSYGSCDNSSKELFTTNLHQIIAKYSDTEKSDWMVVKASEGEGGINLFIPNHSIEEELRKSQITTDEELRNSYKRLLDEKASVSLKENARKLIQSLENDLFQNMEFLQGDLNLPDCRAELIETLRHIQQWFEPKEMKQRAISLDMFLEKMKKKYNTIHTIVFMDEKLKNIKMNNRMIIGNHLLFCNLVRNVEKHSGFSDSKYAQVSVTVSNNDKGELCFDFVNKLSDDCDINIIKKNIEESKERIDLMRNNVPIECQQTGYVKIFEGLKKYSHYIPNINIDCDANRRSFYAMIACKWDPN